MTTAHNEFFVSSSVCVARLVLLWSNKYSTVKFVFWSCWNYVIQGKYYTQWFYFDYLHYVLCFMAWSISELCASLFLLPLVPLVIPIVLMHMVVNLYISGLALPFFL
jgi:hypothetical protein